MTRSGDDEHARVTSELAFAATIMPTVESVKPWTLGTLDHLRSASPSDGMVAGVELGPVLGEGGMGIVRAATQRSLGRDVAVKTLRDDQNHGLAVSKLLREALITGALEHPNIVPVYDLGLDPRGTPMLVLKRISGVAWRELLEAPELVKRRFGAADPLEWHLRILMQVANAVHFAHCRGIVHRDIKPDNVMIGEFGEVYVLDWGISVSLHDDGTRRLPLASEATDIAGTPLYMAPEMFGGEPPDERTDVYLLGATLYEVVVGHPPHRGGSIVEIMSSTITPAPAPEHVPPELVAVWQRAMAYERADRYASAEELRLALQSVLDHRASTRLCSGAATSLAELLGELEKESSAERREAIYNSYGECAFGFRQALEDWPDNEVARRGLREATVAMARYELEHEDPRAARVLLAKLDPPAEDLAQRLRELEERVRHSAERIEALERLDREMDPNAGLRGRTALLVVLGALWVVVPLLVGSFYAASPDYASLFPVPATMLAVVLVGALTLRRSMMRTTLNRSIVGAAALAFFAQMAIHVGSWLARVPPDESQRFILFNWFLISAMMAITVAPRLAIGAVGYLVAYVLASRWFGLRYVLMAGSNALLLVVAFTAFGRRRPPHDGPSRRGDGAPEAKPRAARDRG